jgi:isoamylase
VMGDEVRRTQGGNNNAYCHDSPLSWMDWERTKQHKDIYDFFKGMIAFRKEHTVVHRSRFFTGEVNERGLADASWHGCRLNEPGWNDPACRVLAFTLGGFDGEDDLHVMMNMHWDDLDFEVPTVAGRRWVRAVDTAAPSGKDVVSVKKAPKLDASTCRVAARSVVVLVSRK